ncbi:poly-gamma-glutamate system protein [bacterium]|nr:poly-gamma-glutamate system protein [bacterium]
MYRPTIKSNLWLGLMTLAFIVLYYWSDVSRINVQAPYYKEKIEAARTMAEAIEALKNFRLPQFEHADRENGLNDPLLFTMLNEKDSPITTDEGRIEDKITVLNPNFAAVVVDLLVKSGVKEGQSIAVTLTGSMPGANLALYSAAKALKIRMVPITSVGSSWWGANSPDFTWLDMEQVLLEEGIFDSRSIAASIGGSDDHGGLRLSVQGRNLIADAIDRNEVTFIHEGSLSDNIQARMELYERHASISSYKAFINIGGGIAAIGHRQNASLIPTGVNFKLPAKNYPGLGCVHYFAEAGVPIIQIGYVTRIAREYDLPINQYPLPRIGNGIVYEHEIYNLTVAVFALILMFIILVVVKYLDYRKFKWREEKIDHDSII